MAQAKRPEDLEDFGLDRLNSITAAEFREIFGRSPKTPNELRYAKSILRRWDPLTQGYPLAKYDFDEHLDAVPRPPHDGLTGPWERSELREAARQKVTTLQQQVEVKIERATALPPLNERDSADLVDHRPSYHQKNFHFRDRTPQDPDRRSSTAPYTSSARPTLHNGVGKPDLASTRSHYTHRLVRAPETLLRYKQRGDEMNENSEADKHRLREPVSSTRKRKLSQCDKPPSRPITPSSGRLREATHSGHSESGSSPTIVAPHPSSSRSSTGPQTKSLTDPEWQSLATLVNQAWVVLEGQEGLHEELAPSQGPCWHHVVLNACNRGPNCGFTHSPPASLAWYGRCVVRGFQERGIREISLRLNHQKEQRPCQFQSSYGKCKKRYTGCQYVHDLAIHRYMAVRSVEKWQELKEDYSDLVRLLGL